MQYCAALILLHRPAANYGMIANHDLPESSAAAQQICISNAKRIAHILEDYQMRYPACTLSGITLHIMATAATTLIADIVQQRVQPQEEGIRCLRQVMKALRQLEKSYTVTRRVKKIIQLTMTFLNLDINQHSMRPESFIPHVQSAELSDQTERAVIVETPQQYMNELQNILPISNDSDHNAWPNPWDVTNPDSSLPVQDFLFPTATQFEFSSQFDSGVS